MSNAGYYGWQNDYFDYEPPEPDLCPHCQTGEMFPDTNEFGDLVFRCGECGFSEVAPEDDEPPVIVELSDF